MMKEKKMSGLRADRVFFYLLLLLVTIITTTLIWPYMGAVVLAVTFAVVLQPMHGWFERKTGGRKGLATGLTLVTTVILIVIPVLLGTVLLIEAFAALSVDVADIMQQQGPGWMAQVERFEQWLRGFGLAERLNIEADQVTQTVNELTSELGTLVVRWLAAAGSSIFNLVLPMVIFISLLGTLLTNDKRAVKLVKSLSPLDDGIDQIFLDRMRIMTKAMMRSIVVVAVVQGVVTGLIMALGGTPHVIALTVLAILLSILPGGAAIIAVPVGILQIMMGETWIGLLIIFGTVTFVASLDNQVRPRLVSKDAYLNRAFVLLSVFSGIVLFGFMGIVYGPLIMILFSTVLEVYLKYYRPGPPEVTAALPADAPVSASTVQEAE